MVDRGQRKLEIVVALELLIWHSLVVCQHQTYQYKQNITKLNLVYGYFE